MNHNVSIPYKHGGIASVDFTRLDIPERPVPLIDSKAVDVELVITDRNTDLRVIERAGLVMEMREVKHYYIGGVVARKGTVW
ncbi:hypothetical protein DRO30_04875 [Candidatus Bathyarchaeota archaeon]|nr:MAG: hypothetical protein DRO30_04875 [Candidatus Bathyarchaeota archaeon]